MQIGIDIGGTNMRVGLVNDGQIISQISEPTQADRSEQVILDHLINLIARVINGQVQSIGIGVPSVVDIDKGIVYNVANIPSWREVHLKSLLEQKFSLPVSVNNDCNCFALGEYCFGQHGQYAHLVGLTLGTGVGAGLIMNRKLYVGHNTGAGEVGSFPYLDADFETYCSGRFFAERYNMSGADAAQNYQDGNLHMKQIWQEYGTHVGHLFKAILYAYDPEIIVIGGSIAKSFPYFSEALYRELVTFPYPQTTERLQVKVSELEQVALLGAAMLPEYK